MFSQSSLRNSLVSSPQVMATAVGMTSLAPTTLSTSGGGQDSSPAPATEVAAVEHSAPQQPEMEAEHEETEASPSEDGMEQDRGSDAGENLSFVFQTLFHKRFRRRESRSCVLDFTFYAISGIDDEAATSEASDASGELSVATPGASGTAAPGQSAETQRPPSEDPPGEGEAPPPPPAATVQTNGEGEEESSAVDPSTEPAEEESEQMLQISGTGDGAGQSGSDGATTATTNASSVVMTQILNIPGMEETQSFIQSIPPTTTNAVFDGRKMVSLLNQPATSNGQGDNFETAAAVLGDNAGISQETQPAAGGQEEHLTLVDQNQAVTLPDGQQIVTYVDESAQLSGNSNQQIQMITTETGETYQIALPEGTATSGVPIQYMTPDGQIITVKDNVLSSGGQGDYMVVDNGNLGDVPTTTQQQAASDNVQYVVYTSGS